MITTDSVSLFRRYLGDIKSKDDDVSDRAHHALVLHICSTSMRELLAEDVNVNAMIASRDVNRIDEQVVYLRFNDLVRNHFNRLSIAGVIRGSCQISMNLRPGTLVRNWHVVGFPGDLIVYRGMPVATVLSIVDRDSALRGTRPSVVLVRDHIPLFACSFYFGASDFGAKYRSMTVMTVLV